MQAAEELSPSQWRDHQVACGGAFTEANGWHQSASELLLRGNLFAINVCCTLVHHIVSGAEDQRGSLAVAQHQLALEFVQGVLFWMWRKSCGDGMYVTAAGLSSWELLAKVLHTGGSHLMVVT